jgi:hypothetical protein
MPRYFRYSTTDGSQSSVVGAHTTIPDESLPQGIAQVEIAPDTLVDGMMMDLKTLKLVPAPIPTDADIIAAQCKDMADQIAEIKSRGKAWQDGLDRAVAEKGMILGTKG